MQYFGAASADEPREGSNPFAFPPASAVDIAEQHRCAVDHALAELDAGRYAAAATRMTRMEALYPHHSLVVALTATSRLRLRRTGHAKTIDVATAGPKPLAKLRELGYTDPPRLDESMLVQRDAEPGEQLTQWAARHDIERFSVQPDGLPDAIPEDYGRHPLTEWVRDDEGEVAIYGNRYVVVIRAGRVSSAYDARTLFVDAQADPLPPGRGIVRLAAKRGDTLYLSVIDQSGLSGVAAIDTASGKARWQAQARMHGATDFVVTSDLVIIGSERLLYVLRRSDGVAVGRSSLGGRINSMAWQDDRLLVNSSSGSFEYAIHMSGGRG
jgi:hypothetical protein